MGDVDHIQGETNGRNGITYGRVAVRGPGRTERHQVTDWRDEGWLQNTAALDYMEHGDKKRQPSTILNGRTGGALDHLELRSK